MITGINHITLAVRDIDESFNFYAEVLGFQPIQKSPISAYFLAGDVWLALTKDQHARHQQLPEYTHIAFTISQEGFDLMKERIIESGAEEWQQNWTEGDSFYFVDPNGHKFEIHISDLETRIESGKKDWGDEVQWFV